MNISVYKMTSNPIALSKTIPTADATYTGYMHNKTNDVKFDVVLQGADYTALKDCNYAYIDTTNKYYFIESRVMDNNTCVLHLKQDVLYNYAAQIRACSATVMRSSTKYNMYMLDNSYQVLAYKNIVTKAFPNGINTDSIILMTVG